VHLKSTRRFVAPFRKAYRRRRYIALMTHVIITTKANGPLIVEGPVRIVTPDGRELSPPPRKDGKPAEVVVLCRCGGSQTKPFCDGTHKRNGFQDGQGTPG
jgi:CDGSH-type Zn-finger protein